jgi:hypothetical protein
MLFSSPFAIAGILKCLYDAILISLHFMDKTVKHTEGSDWKDDAARPLLPVDRDENKEEE